jgi:putative oxidoreductase
MSTKQTIQLVATDLALLAARLVFGGYMFWEHGMKKWYKWDVIQHDFATPFGLPPYWSAALTIFAEYYCCILIVFGLFTRWAAIPNLICMLVAALVIHAGDPMGDRESAFLYLAGFAIIALYGAGRISVDHWIKKTRLGRWV